MPPPRGKSKPQDFDLLAHLEIREVAEGEEAGDDDEVAEDVKEPVAVQKYRKITQKNLALFDKARP